MGNNGNAFLSPHVIIVVLNWNNYADTIECIKSIQGIAYQNYTILLIDNGSTDNSETILKQKFPDLPFIQTSKNLGYAGGINAGLRYTLDAGADYVFILNNDTIIDNQCLHYMVQSAEEDDRIGMIGSKIYYLNSPDTIWYAGGKIDLKKGGLTLHVGMDTIDDGAYDVPMETEYITGCSILAKRQMIEDIGLLDENYFLYFEDVDWSLRAILKGWRLFYEPRAKVWHKEGAQSQKIYSSKFIYYSLRNRLYFMKHFAPNNMFSCHMLQLKMFFYFVKSSLKQGIPAFWRSFRFAMLSYMDFYVFKRMGRSERV